eukprot:TRINITY_DN12130_c0_g1_i2.p1 TRINITY_DN12130_c0_g1~~TRINITY_DN12130_c0_g1_i2.p1  ORF type:complete len:225 (+),score=26.42 TRINITY_DN12130_c0_g1_i2:1025-1699(+)
MIYRKIGEALRRYGPSGAHPTDYFSVFCLGNREPPLSPHAGGGGGRGQQQPHSPRGTAAERSRRHMVYIHSKMFVVDDEYVLVGSANINERSMAGNRDTEIAVGSWQPAFTLNRGGGPLPVGEVSGLRLGLWAEHFGVSEACHYAPDSVECVRRLRQLGDANWACYAGTAVRTLPFGHAMTYPYVVSADGFDVRPLVPFIPDSEVRRARVTGARCPAALNLVTT